MPPPPHEEVAAYALGLLDADDHDAFERHLLGCADCQAELVELAGVPGLLDEIRVRRARVDGP